MKKLALCLVALVAGFGGGFLAHVHSTPVPKQLYAAQAYISKQFRATWTACDIDNCQQTTYDGVTYEVQGTTVTIALNLNNSLSAAKQEQGGAVLLKVTNHLAGEDAAKQWIADELSVIGYGVPIASHPQTFSDVVQDLTYDPKSGELVFTFSPQQ